MATLEEWALVLSIIAIVLSFATSLAGVIIGWITLSKRFEPRLDIVTVENKYFIKNVGRGIAYSIRPHYIEINTEKKIIGQDRISVLIPQQEMEIKFSIMKSASINKQRTLEVELEEINQEQGFFIILEYKNERNRTKREYFLKTLKSSYRFLSKKEFKKIKEKAAILTKNIDFVDYK